MATMTLDELVTQLRNAYGDALEAAVLYGSAAAGEHSAKRSDYNVLVLVRELPLDRLRAAGAATRAWVASGNPAPMTLTSAEWRNSADVFPMEYADILERHRALTGTLPTDGITVRKGDLRLQLEKEALGKLLALRQGVLATVDDEKRQLELLTVSFSAIMTIFRAVVRLHGETPPVGREPLCREVARLTGLDAEPFVRVARHVREEERLKGPAAGETLARYLAGMEALVRHVDRLTMDA